MFLVASKDEKGYLRFDGCPQPNKTIHIRVNQRGEEVFLELYDGRMGLAVHLDTLRKVLDTPLKGEKE